MKLDMTDVLKNVISFLKTIEGHQILKDATGSTPGCDLVERKKQMVEAGKEMVALIKKHAGAAGLPASVMQHVESFFAGPPTVVEDGSGNLIVSMADSGYRESLQPEKYDGVYDIVMLFNDGYNAAGVVYGRRSNSGGQTSLFGDSNYGYVKSRQSRPPLQFMQAAINEFNATCGPKYNVTASLSR